MTKLPAGTLSNVPEVALGFLVIKALATTEAAQARAWIIAAR